MHYRRIIKQAIIDEGNGKPTYRVDIEADHPLIVSIENRGNSTFYVRVCRNKPEPPEPAAPTDQPISECGSTTAALPEAPQCRPNAAEPEPKPEPQMQITKHYLPPKYDALRHLSSKYDASRHLSSKHGAFRHGVTAQLITYNSRIISHYKFAII